jgi:hypothetical protein
LGGYANRQDAASMQLQLSRRWCGVESTAMPLKDLQGWAVISLTPHLKAGSFGWERQRSHRLREEKNRDYRLHCGKVCYTVK